VIEPARRLGAGALEAWARAAIEAAGADPEPAAVTARCLVDANRRGLDTHGVLILRLYLPRLASGAMDGRARPAIVVDRPAAALVDGRNGLGPFVASFAMDACCDRALMGGAAAVAVRNSNHFGAASCFAEAAARRDCIGIALSNSDPGLAPPGALAPVLGTNPIALAAPGGRGTPIPSLDFATSVVAVGRIRVAERAGDPIPAGWAIGPDGRSTEDPAQALLGSVLPMGGHKGFALAFMLDVLSGCLSGARISPEIPDDPAGLEPQGTGHCFLAIHVPSLNALDAYGDRLDALADAVHAAARADGVEPFQIPGEPETRTASQRADRIPFDAGSIRLLEALGDQFGVPFPPA
jgi:LDH2 family malate/lactate/ureidoglycolate dehydrogenase